MIFFFAFFPSFVVRWWVRHSRKYKELINVLIYRVEIRDFLGIIRSVEY